MRKTDISKAGCESRLDLQPRRSSPKGLGLMEPVSCFSILTSVVTSIARCLELDEGFQLARDVTETDCADGHAVYGSSRRRLQERGATLLVRTIWIPEGSNVVYSLAPYLPSSVAPAYPTPGRPSSVAGSVVGSLSEHADHPSPRRLLTPPRRFPCDLRLLRFWRAIQRRGHLERQ